MSTDAKIRELERAVMTDPSKLVALQHEYARVGRGWDGQDLPRNEKGYMVVGELPGDYDWRVILDQTPAQAYCRGGAAPGFHCSLLAGHAGAHSDTYSDRLAKRASPVLAIPMCYVTPGEFVMGCNTSSYDDEKPEHRRDLPGYWIAKLPTGEADYAIFARATGREIPTVASPETRGAVVNVSWEDSVAFCDWSGLSLQSEEQFEKAARGPDGLIYPWGNEWQPDPNKRGPSPYGVEDMCGVVWQWTADAYDADAYKKVVDGQSAVPFDPALPTASAGAAAGAARRTAPGSPRRTATTPWASAPPGREVEDQSAVPFDLDPACTGSTVAVAGRTVPSTSARRTGTGTLPTSASTTWAFAPRSDVAETPEIPFDQASTGSTVAGAGTSPRATAARRTASGTRRATATSTSASGSPAPEPAESPFDPDPASAGSTVAVAGRAVPTSSARRTGSGSLPAAATTTWAFAPPSDNAARVLRGGSWFYGPSGCRAAYRFRRGPGYRRDFFGVRLAFSRGSARAPDGDDNHESS